MATETNPFLRHEAFTEYLPVWRKCRDASKGERAVQANAVEYLPRLTGQSDDHFKAYAKRGSYFNATGRTIDGMVGMIFRKPPTVTAPKELADILGDVTQTGLSLMALCQKTLIEDLTVGRCGLLVDMPTTPENTVITKAVAEQQNLRPYVAFYTAEQIIYWKSEFVQNKWQPVEICLSESYDEADETGAIKSKEQIRRLLLVDGKYYQEIWRKNAGGTPVVYQTLIPKRNGQQFDVIPFYPFSPDFPSIDISQPPVEDLVNVNLSHWRNSCDLENGCHMAGMPTLFISGTKCSDEQGKPIAITVGTDTAIVVPESEADAKYVEVGSEGFASIEKLMEKKIEQMAALGARMISPEKKAAEAAETAQIRRGGENSVLGNVATVTGAQLTKVIKFLAEWAGINGDVSVELNTDFVPPEFTSADLKEWTAALQSGSISPEIYFDVLMFSEWLRNDMTFEEFQAQREAAGPALGSIPPRVPTAPANA